jgi:hypothetical protein
MGALDFGAVRSAHAQIGDEVTVQIKDDRGDAYDPPVTMTFAPLDSARFQAARSAAILDVQRIAPLPEQSKEQSSDDKGTPGDRDMLALWEWDYHVKTEALARAALRWTGLEEGGKPVPVNVENARMLLQFKHILDQVVAGVGDTPARSFRATGNDAG